MSEYPDELYETKIWNEFAGCWDDSPTEEQCKEMRKMKQCPYPSCPLYPCWERDIP